MTPVNSTIIGYDPDNDLYGDCHRACLASVMGIPIETVPHFMDGDKFGKDTEERLQAQDEWLNKRGLSYVELPLQAPSLQDALDFIGRYSGEAHWILVAKSQAGCGHSVVCFGNEIIHDPTYGDDGPHGIVGPLDDKETGESWYWAMFITLK